MRFSFDSFVDGVLIMILRQKRIVVYGYVKKKWTSAAEEFQFQILIN